MTYQGKIESVEIAPNGTEVVEDASVGATELRVLDIADFREDGGSLTLDDAAEIMLYIGLRELDDTLLLAEPLAAAVPVDTPVYVFPYGENKIALIRNEDGDDSVFVRIPFTMQALLEEGVRTLGAEETALYEEDDEGEFYLVDVISRLTVYPRDALNIPDLDVATLELANLNNVVLPQLQTDLSNNQIEIDNAQIAIAQLNGLFPITETSISDGAITTPKMTANSINGDRITGNTIIGDKIITNTLHGDRVIANTLSGDTIIANTFSGNKLVANSITGNEINANAINGMVIYGAEIIGGVFKTNTGYDDIEIVPGNLYYPSAMNFFTNSPYYDATAPARIQCFDDQTATYDTVNVRLQGAKMTTSAVAPRIDIGTYRNRSTGELIANMDYYAGGSSGNGAHYFWRSGVKIATFDQQGFFLEGGKALGVGIVSASVPDDGITAMGPIKSSNAVECDNGFFDYGMAGGGFTGANINNSGRIYRTSSSRKDKKYISPLGLEEARLALSFEAVTFRWRADTGAGDDGNYYPGFIAEQVDEVGGNLWTTRDQDGVVTGLRYAEITAAHNVLLKDQEERIKILENALVT